jgi:excisionase family DNA binding protein
MPRTKSKSSPAVPSGITPRLLTIQEAARYLSATVWAVRALLWAKELRHVQIGKRFLIDRNDLDQFVTAKLQECVR